MVWWVMQKVHGSWRVALASGAFVLGVASAQWIRLPSLAGLGLLILTIPVLFIKYTYVLPVIAVFGMVIGISYGSMHLTERRMYAGFIGTQATVKGRVKEDVNRSSGGTISAQLENVYINGTDMPGSMLVSGRSVGEALRGDVIELKGTVKEGFGSFPASVAINTIIAVERHTFSDIGRVVRDWFANKIRTVLPEPQASLGIGFLTGQKTALPSDLADALKVAGLTHIVVASGYNLTILVRLARKLLLKISKYLSAVSSGIMIVAFIAITGLSPSMTRAGLVSGMSLVAWYYGHAFHPIVLLLITAAITVAFQPSYAWGDMGWQLSFASFMGVMLVAPLLHAYFFSNEEPGVFRQILGETIAAHLVTIPIIALAFGTISNVALIANVLVVPLVPIAMLLTFFCGLGAIWSAPFIVLLSTPTTWLLTYMTNVATYVAELPWAQSKLTQTPLLWLAYIVLLGVACLWMWRKTRYSFRDNQALLY